MGWGCEPLKATTTTKTMEDYRSLSHAKWQCKHHVIFIPKCRRKKLYGVLRRELGEVFRRLAEQKECEIIEGHIMVDRVHMVISISPKLAVSSVVGYKERDPCGAPFSQEGAELRRAVTVGGGALWTPLAGTQR